MVGAWLPQYIVSLHLFISTEDVLQGIVQGMAHMEGPGDIGGRDHDAIGRLVRDGLTPEKAVFLPVGIPFFFYLFGFITFGNLFSFHQSASPDNMLVRTV